MRELNSYELEAVSGGELTQAGNTAMTLTLVALCPTPLVLAAGAVALMYYAWC